MADNLEKTSPAFKVKLLGKERLFRFNLKSCSQYKKLTGEKILDGGYDVFDAEKLAALLWAGLIPDDKELDGVIDANGKADQHILDFINEVLDAVNYEDMPYFLNDVVKRAIDLGKPPEEAKKKGVEKAK